MPPEKVWEGVINARPARLVKTRDAQGVVHLVFGYQYSATSMDEPRWDEWNIDREIATGVGVTFTQLIIELLLIAPKVTPGVVQHRRG